MRAIAVAIEARCRGASTSAYASSRCSIAAGPSTRVSASPSSTSTSTRSGPPTGSSRARRSRTTALSDAPRDRGGARRGPEHGDGGPPAATRGEQEVRGDLLGCGTVLLEHPGRPLVLQRALGGRQVVVDRVADERVDEGEAALVGEHLGAAERVERRGGVVLRLAGEGRDRRQARASPSTATARATAVRTGGIRRSRSVTRLDTAREPTARTVSGWDTSGRTPSASSARRSWRSSSGLPDVMRWHASTNASAASPSRSCTSVPVAPADSGRGRSTLAEESRTSSASRASSSCGSPVRSRSPRATGTPSSRLTR